jgi:hypothetical protein
MATFNTPLTTEVPQRERVLRIADTCFEMFTIYELKRPVTILHELAHSFPEASATEISEAISLAISWRRALRRARGWMH